MLARTRWLMLAMAGGLLACASPSGPVVPPEYSLAEAADSIPVAFGHAAIVDGILVSFTDVLSDSRCPVTADCVQAGDAAIAVTVAPQCVRSMPPCEAPEWRLILHTTDEPRAGDALGFTVRVMTLQPVRATPAPIPSERYMAWLQIRPIVR